jgi:hypothetical protein
MAKAKKTYREKLHESGNLPLVEPIPLKMARTFGEGTLCIPAPIEVDEIMRLVPPGRLITVNQIRQIIARRHGATIGCPITTGLFVAIAARAAEEEEIEGNNDVTPYWRTLKSKGELNEKYPGGVVEQARRLIAEGHEIENDRAGKPKRVKDWEAKLVEG